MRPPSRSSEALEATQLVTAEIPVAVRLLAPELSTLVARALAAAGILLAGAVRIARDGNGNALAIGLVVAATAWAVPLLVIPGHAR